jgi:hypothetical protein
MISINYIARVLVLLNAGVSGYTNEWSWISGSKSASGKPVYGDLGEYNNDYTPSARLYTAQCYHARLGKLFIFGGTGFDLSSATGTLSDLWAFDSAIEQWSWLGRYLIPNYAGDYRGRGTFTEEGWPCGRRRATLICDETQDELHLFGGDTPSQALDDYWKYNINSTLWMWVSGNSPGQNVYNDIPAEMKGIQRLTNAPATSEKSFYLYSGYTGGSGTGRPFVSSDKLWKYNYSVSNWEEMSQVDKPSSRLHASMVYDENNDRIIVYGGEENVNTGGESYSAIYEYRLDTGVWKRLGLLEESLQTYAFYETIRVFQEKNYPGGRHGAQASFITKTGILIVYGGVGFGRSGQGSGYLGDLWQFDSEKEQWAFIDGTITISSGALYANRKESCQFQKCHPGPKAFGVSFYDPNSEKIYLFAGIIGQQGLGVSITNDLWSYDFSNTTRPKTTIIRSNTRIMAQTTTTSRSNLTDSLTRIQPRPPPVENLDQNSPENSTPIMVGGIFAGVVGFFALAALYLLFRKRRKYPNINDPRIPKGTPAEMARVTIEMADAGLIIPGLREFHRDEYKAVQFISKGTIGEIFLAEAVSPQLKWLAQVVIVKQIGMVDVAVPGAVRTAFDLELQFMASVHEFKHCAKVIGYCTNPVSMIMLFYPQGSLKMFLYHPETKIPWKLRFSLAQDIAKGIQSIHSKGIVHCDVKPDNILLDIDADSKRLYCLISDFSMAKSLPPKSLQIKDTIVPENYVFSTAYAAPEVFPKNNRIVIIRTPRDVFAWAMVVHEILHRKQPWA